MRPPRVGLALLLSVACAGRTPARLLRDLDPAPLPQGVREIRMRNTGWLSPGPVLLLRAEGTRVVGDWIEFLEVPERERADTASGFAMTKQEMQQRYGCRGQWHGAIWACRPAFARGRPDWALLMHDMEALLSTAPSEGTSPPGMVCTDGNSWHLQYRTSAGRRDEHKTYCYAVDPQRQAFELAIDSVFWRVLDRAIVQRHPTR